MEPVVTCQIRLVSEDVMLETREMDAVPGIGEEIIIEGAIYQTATTPADVVDDVAIVYVKKLSGA